MKNAGISAKISFGFMIILLFLFTSLKVKQKENINEEEFISIEDYRLHKTITGKGGYSGNCIEMELTNLSHELLQIKLEPGRRLVSEDTLIQDILIVKEEVISLQPNEKKTIAGYGFCCQSSNKGPYKGAVFKSGYVAPPDWVLIAEFLNQHDFDKHMVQQAVWVVSNNHSIASVYGSDKNLSDLLRRKLAHVTGQELPWYSISYIEDSSNVFTDKPDKVWGDIEFEVRHNSMISIVVRHTKGKMQTIKLEEYVIPGGGKQTFKKEFSVAGWPKGEYELCIFEDEHNLKVKKTFKL